LTVNSKAYNSTTINVCADTPWGNASNVIVVGSHLDSVPAGPGINDNGSGSSTNLELAIQLMQLGLELANKVRFCWWAAEEMGLLGSTYYVSSLTPEELANIALNLNFDMVASPNYQIGIYNASGAAASIRTASTTIQNLFINAFQTRDMNYVLVEFTGRSDYGPFIGADPPIPAGGLFTGAEQIKSMQERTLFGGLANAAYDPCYHQACDDIYNLNDDAFLFNAQAAAEVLQTLASQQNLREYLQNPNPQSTARSVDNEASSSYRSNAWIS